MNASRFDRSPLCPEIVARVGRLWSDGRDTFDIGRTLGIPESRAVYLVSEYRDHRRRGGFLNLPENSCLVAFGPRSAASNPSLIASGIGSGP